MLLKKYRKEINYSQCNANYGSLQCIAHLDEDISEALPYVNATMGGYQYTTEPPSVTLKTEGRVIVLYPRQIAISYVEDDTEAEEVLEWIRQKINTTWKMRGEIEPCFEGYARPNIIEILRILKDVDCRECGQPSCVAFAVEIAEGRMTLEDCPMLSEEHRVRLESYLEECCVE
jgi:ArsR family metal-binding transcriptional regulator